jgi:hypothetical protein
MKQYFKHLLNKMLNIFDQIKYKLIPYYINIIVRTYSISHYNVIIALWYRDCRARYLQLCSMGNTNSYISFRNSRRVKKYRIHDNGE